MRLAIINDIHANATALQAALETAREIGNIDRYIILGDLLSYGVCVDETLNLLVELNCQERCHFIKGNHDQVYFDLQNQIDFRYKPLPRFIEESILYTGDQLTERLEDLFEWEEYTHVQSILFAHANAFEYSNWSYLNTEEDFRCALSEIQRKGFRAGIFGHTHRTRYLAESSSDFSKRVVPISAATKTVAFETRFALTNGSLGQPRGESASFLLCDIIQERVTLRQFQVKYNVDLHCKKISHSSLTAETKEKLISYYENN